MTGPGSSAPPVPDSPEQLALDESVHGLELRDPDLSASRVVSRGQVAVTAAAVVALAAGVAVSPLSTGVALAASVTVLYAGMLLRNLRLFRRLLDPPMAARISDEAARGIPDAELPLYTVLVPAYGEPEVIGATLQALDRIEYPRDRLDIKLLLEADDLATQAAVRAAQPPKHIQLVMVPPAEPRTKPKALNFGLRIARGDYVTIYDAEDRPDPLQLRRAVATFGVADPRVACLQARLEYHNASQNLLTAWFSLEYLTWFGFTLPAIAGGRTPVPLGGTSMHIRGDVLRSVGAWDPHNVTEDCDLGVRLYRMGYRTQILDSVTYEEANSDVINWVKQRSRWVKGYAQSWLVHMRHPVRLWRELGPRGFVGFNLLVGGTTLTSVLNPFLWTLTALWFSLHPAGLQSVFPDPIYYPAMLSLIVGNFLAYYACFVTLQVTGRAELLKAALLMPVYWGLMSLAAMRALLQILVSPFVWEKTVHGLDVPLPEARG
jgi:glycosyltransferase XagB